MKQSITGNIFLVVLFFLQGIVLHAQKYSIDNYSVSDGLAQSQVSALSFDIHEQLWIGTRGGGINIFNGQEFRSITKKDGLSSNSINSIFIKDSNIWIGTDKGLNFISRDSILQINSDSSLASATIYDIEIASDSIFIASSKGIYILNSNFTVAKHIETNKSKGGLIVDLLKTSKNELWAAGSKGIIIFKQDTIEILRNINRVRNNSFTCLLEDKQGNIWTGSSGGGISVIYSRDSIINFSKTNGLLAYDVSDIKEDKTGNIWIASHNKGICKFDGQKFVSISSKNGLKTDYINCISSQNNGAIWIGTGTGLSQFNGFEFILHDENSFLEGGYTLFEDNKDSSIWIGTKKGGVIHIKNGIKKRYNSSNGFCNNRTRVIYRDSAENIWLGTDGKGIFRYNKGTFHKTPYTTTWCRSIVSDTNGTIWFGTLGNDLIAYQYDEFKHYGLENGLNNHRINQLNYDANTNSLWIATDRGISRFKNDTIINYSVPQNLPEGRYMSVITDQRGTVWTGELGGGLYKLNNAEQFEKSTLPIQSENIYSIYKASDNSILVGTEKGIDRIYFTPEGNYSHIEQIGITEGLLGIEVMKNGIIETIDHTLWYCTMDGITEHQPWHKLIQAKSNPRLTNIMVNYESISHLNIINSDLSISKNTFKYDENDFIFEFDQHNISTKKATVFSSKLVGYDNKWSPFNSQKIANYKNLPPGTYHFYINTNHNLIPSKPTYSFTINPPYWQTDLFIIGASILGIIILSSIGLSIYFRIKNNITKKHDELETQRKLIELEQKALHLQMNPHFLFNCLNSIKGTIALKDTKQAKLELDQFAKLMRLMLTNTREGTIEFSKEIEMIQLYLNLEKLNREKTFTFSFNTKDLQFENFNIPAMIIQPLVENAIVHGIAKSEREGDLKINFKQHSSKVIKCTIRDNGFGLNTSTKDKLHESTALKNISARLAILSKQLELKELTLTLEEQTPGTLVTLFLPIIFTDEN